MNIILSFFFWKLFPYVSFENILNIKYHEMATIKYQKFIYDDKYHNIHYILAQNKYP